jgi:hypothetical protein
MNPDERRERLTELAHLPSDADACEDIRHVFLPLPRHGLALRTENFIVRGDRGAGKTALFKFLDKTRNDTALLTRLFPGARIDDVAWVDGFSASSTKHPDPANLERASPKDEWAMRLFWSAHLACRLIEERRCEAGVLIKLYASWQENRHDVTAWLEQAETALPTLTQWLDQLDSKLSHPLCVTYDHLDKIAVYDPSLRQRYVGGLLALWGSLGIRYRYLRPKIFLREDIFQTSLASFSDASKLRSRSVSLDWDKEALFKVLIRHAASLHEGLRTWIERGARKIPLQDDLVLGPMPPDLPETGAVSQKAFVDHLAGPLMGDGAKKGYTYRWIPNRLQDANVRVVPRSLLNLVAYAADRALHTGARATHERLLTPADLVAGLQQTSLNRVNELEEEYKFVSRLHHLEERTVLMDRREVERALSLPYDGADGLDNDGAKVVEELVRIGVLSVRPRDRIDVPDIYRYGLRIKRKGGVAHPI